MSSAVLDQLDLRTLPAADHAAVLLEQLDALEPGAGFILLAGADPAPFREQLQADRPNALEWWPLECGPAVWRVHVTRHDGDPAVPRTITNVMCADHQRLDKLYGRIDRALETGNGDAARGLLAEFRVGIDRHIAAEEDVLMPLLAERCQGRWPKDAAQMRVEHQGILAELTNAEAALATRAPDNAGRARTALTNMRFLLEGHNQNEERVLYPLSDSTATPTERADLLKRIQAL